MVGFTGLVGAALGLVFEQAWRPTLAITSAAISLAAIVPWWSSVVAGAKGRAIFDLLIIVLLLSRWGETVAKALR